MSLDIENIAIDPKLATSGVWTTYMGGEFLLARKGPAYQDRLGALYQEHFELIKSKSEEGIKKLQWIYVRAFAETVLINWRGINKGGKTWKFSVDAATELLGDPRYVELASHLEAFSLTHEHYREAVNTDVAKTVKNTAVS